MKSICCGSLGTHSGMSLRIGVKGLLLSSVLIVTLLLPCSAEGAKPSLEYQVKASMIFNFLQFVEWPAGELEKFPTVLPVCLSGNNRFGSALDVMEREIVKGRHLKFREVDSSSPESFEDCLALFITNDQDGQDVEVLKRISGRSILTIGESDHFLDNGGIINLSLEGGRITFEVNRAAALQARLDLSSRLLRIAREVRE